MKKTLLLFSLIYLFSCTKSKDNFSKYEWVLNYEKYDDDYNVSKHQRVLFKNDSAISYSNLSYPLIKKDSLIIFKQHHELYSSRRDTKTNQFLFSKRGDTMRIDTLLYDFKILFDTPFLITRGLNSNKYEFLTTNQKDIEFNESNYFSPITSFKISAYQIGDTIAIDKLINIENHSYIDNLITGSLEKNEDIEFEVINRRYVFNIKQKNIDKGDIKNIIKVINKKTKLTPETIDKHTVFYEEGYSWKSKDISIQLTKKNMFQYYMDRYYKTVGDSYGVSIKKTLYLDRATESVGKDYYTLKYNNLFLQGALMSLNIPEEQSSIIE